MMPALASSSSRKSGIEISTGALSSSSPRRLYVYDASPETRPPAFTPRMYWHQPELSKLFTRLRAKSMAELPHTYFESSSPWSFSSNLIPSAGFDMSLYGGRTMYRGIVSPRYTASSDSRSWFHFE